MASLSTTLEHHEVLTNLLEHLQNCAIQQLIGDAVLSEVSATLAIREVAADIWI